MRRTANILRARSLQSAFKDFMNATATGGYRTNEGVVVHVMGAQGTNAHDCPSFDLVRDKYEVRKACTFEQAFRACWHGSRDWRDFDLETLRDSSPEFRHLQLPDRVQAAISSEEYVEHEKRARANAGMPEQEEEYEDLPPLELLRRAAPPSKRRRKMNRKVRSAVRGKSKVARAYRAAKKEYHRLGEQLHWQNIKGTLL